MALSGPRFYLTGGTSNLDPNASLGGAASQLYNGSFGNQVAEITEGSISGLSIADASGVASSGLLAYTPGTGILRWAPDGQTPFYETLGSDGLYMVGDGSQHLIVNITSSSLPAVFTEVQVNLSDSRPNVFDSITYTERGTGTTEYRCLFIKNHSGTDLTSAILTVTTPGTGTMQIGTEFAGSGVYTLDSDAMEVSAYVFQALSVDVEGNTNMNTLTDDSWYFQGLSWVGAPKPSAGGAASQDSNGTSTQLPFTLADETDSTTQLSGVTWGTSITWDLIAAGKFVSFWLKRVYPSSGTGAEANNQVQLKLLFTGG